MSDESSSDEDMSLADMIKQTGSSKGKKTVSPEAAAKPRRASKKRIVESSESDSDSDEGKSLSELVKHKPAPKTDAKQSEADESEYSEESEDGDDNLSLADLKKRITKTPKARAKRAHSTSKSKSSRPAAKKKKASTHVTAPVPTGQRRIHRTAGRIQKTQLVEAVLVRWHYVMTWPVLRIEEDEIQAKEGYIELRGFKGVFVGVVGDDTGKIEDYRDHSKSPSFNNLIKKPSSELKDLAETAINKQIKILSEQEGDTDNSVLIKHLKTELSDIRKVSANHADKQWKQKGF